MMARMRIYVLAGRILEVYLLDALLELCIVMLLLGGWLFTRGSV